MAKLTRKQLDEEIKLRFLGGVKEHLENCGEEVLMVKSNEIALPVVDEDGNELVLPKSEQIPSDFFRKGDTIKAVIQDVEMNNNTPVITLSRTSPQFLERLFEQEVPEIFPCRAF